MHAYFCMEIKLYTLLHFDYTFVARVLLVITKEIIHFELLKPTLC